ncbi:lipocalin-like domain-containing protein [Legionella tucsonensis]|uniref:Hydroxyneurosporene synthase (CrtC) n=1 Tax=Legionella tucsonensis TaxID=40335 RepID=A0A0W0ZX36_9GAMM|nr:lipocalin-like domain-containing protein [Legionella tucsonensis]KTD73708.1 Hydroxyneurosporene synthase (CrtC) [Legionella tucsonensis]
MSGIKWMLIGFFASASMSHANLPYFPLDFPRDEAAHYQNIPYSFDRLIEWWYFNGKLVTDEGRHLSFDVALFNSAINVKGRVYTQPMLHMQVADLDNKIGYGVAKDYFLNEGKFATDKLNIILKNDYSLQKKIQQGKEVYLLKAEGRQNNTVLKFNLVLEPNAPFFLINENGLMPMADDTNSYYYSIPHFKTTGNLKLNDKIYQINQNPGDSWMDHQWGDFNLDANGWEWLGVRLNNGIVANIFLIFNFNGNNVIGGLANVILPSGEKQFISYQEMEVIREDYWLDPELSILYPTTYRINIPSIGLSFTNVAAFPEQEKHGYWEGYCEISGNYNQHEVSGFSYTEIVYQNPTLSFSPRLSGFENE